MLVYSWIFNIEPQKPVSPSLETVEKQGLLDLSIGTFAKPTDELCVIITQLLIANIANKHVKLHSHNLV